MQSQPDPTTTPGAAAIEPDALYTTEQAAALFGLSVASLERWRVTGNGPRFSRVGRRVRYLGRDLLAYVHSRTFGSTAEADDSERQAARR